MNETMTSDPKGRQGYTVRPMGRPKNVIRVALSRGGMYAMKFKEVKAAERHCERGSKACG